MLFDPVVLKVSAQYGGFFFNAFLLYVALPVVLCSVVGAFCRAIRNPPGEGGFGIGLSVGCTAVFVNLGWFLIISATFRDDVGDSFAWMPFVIALGAAVLTGILAMRVTEDL